MGLAAAAERPMPTHASPPHDRPDRILHDAFNALAAARAQVDLARRRLARGVPSAELDRNLSAALRSLDDLTALMVIIDRVAERRHAEDAVLGEEPAHPDGEHAARPAAKRAPNRDPDPSH